MNAVDPNGSFIGPTETHDFDGLLFDMDGTIIDSTDAIIRHWHKLGKQLGVDGEAILASSHGVRSIETLALYDKSLANWEYISHIEGLIPERFGENAIELPGSRNLIDCLSEKGVPWAIVTSGTRALVTGWLKIMNLARPENLVTAEDVQRGKPDPACYLLGQAKLASSKSKARILVLEDAPSGVRAGKAAGFEVLAVATTHSTKQLLAAGADYIVKDLRSVRLAAWDPTLQTAKVEITNKLQ